jgi:hypothetical protein
MFRPYRVIIRQTFIYNLFKELFILHCGSKISLLVYILYSGSKVSLLVYTLHSGSKVSLLVYIWHSGSKVSLLVYILHSGSKVSLLVYILHSGNKISLLVYILHSGSKILLLLICAKNLHDVGPIGSRHVDVWILYKVVFDGCLLLILWFNTTGCLALKFS